MLYSYRDRQVSSDPAEIRKFVSTPNSDILMLRASIADVKKNEKFQDSLIKVIETPWVRAAMKKKQQLKLQKNRQVNASLKAGLNAGSNSSLGKLIEEHPCGAKLYSAGNITAADFLAKLSSRFKGKAIVLDFWATWCGPCIAAMPSMMAVNKQAIDLPVEFVYLCTSSNSSPDLWKKQVIKMKQQGTHVFLNEKLANELRALFGKGGFPTYVYLDRKGQMSKAISDSEHLSINAVKRLVE
jgi:thiol-disulfide isomerase/thioredoxin